MSCHLIGFFAGAPVWMLMGVFLSSLCIVARDADEAMEILRREQERNIDHRKKETV